MQPAIPTRRKESGRLRAENRRCRVWQSGGLKTVAHVTDSTDALYTNAAGGFLARHPAAHKHLHSFATKRRKRSSTTVGFVAHKQLRSPTEPRGSAIRAEAKRRRYSPPRPPASADALYKTPKKARRLYSCASSAAHSITAAPIPSRALSISPSTSQPDSVANTDSKHIITDATAGGVIFCATTCSV